MKTPLALSLLFAAPLAADPLQDPGRPVASTSALSPAQTAAQMEVPEGFRVELIAGEPEVVQPIAYTIDDRGRLWIAECTNYPDSPGEPRDRIIVLSDEDGDGIFEKHQVFWDKAHFSSGIAVGFGGVWLGSPPNLLFLPDKDGDAVMDGEPQIVLDGWGAEDTHETLNNFIWGPDGWLYGTQGVFTHSKVGKPGTPDDERVKINAGIWRYHPTREVFELWCEGVSNQWGLDWDDHGSAFFATCVVPHMWHAIDGAHYTRQAGAHFNPNLYEDIKTIAWGRYEKAAYCGAMVYLGDAFPDEWRNKFFFHDIHMNKLRCEKFIEDGSGYRSERKADFLHSPDAWFRGLSPQYGQDGGVFISDWYDKVPCHQQRAYTDRSNGRIYKIVNDQVEPTEVDLRSSSDMELVELQLHRNDWYVRHSRRLLQERGAKPETTAALEKILFGNDDDTRQLRALWTLHCQQALTEDTALKSLEADSEHVRGWTVTCITEQGTPSAALLARLVTMAENDPSKKVRLRLASAAQRIATDQRWPLLTALSQHAGDADDRNLPLMYWYAAETAVGADPQRGVELLKASRIPKLRQFIARRIVVESIASPGRHDEAMASLVSAIADHDSSARSEMLRGMLAAASAQRQLPEPKTWPDAYPRLRDDSNDEVRRSALALALIFGSESAFGELREILTDSEAPTDARQQAMNALVEQRDPETVPILLGLVGADGPLRADAVRLLSNYDDTSIPDTLVAAYPSLDTDEKNAALTTLAARPESVRGLFAAIDAGDIPANDITAQLARLIQGFDQPEFDEWLADNWGALNPSNQERQKEIERYRKFLGHDAISRADVNNGRVLYQQLCSACHAMFDPGGDIGPHLPGNFDDVEYLLQNILDPNAAIGVDYQQTFITKKDGSLIGGIITEEGDKSVTLKTLAEPVVVLKEDIEKRELSPRSMMPSGLLNGLEEPEVRDLFLYLRQSENP